MTSFKLNLEQPHCFFFIAEKLNAGEHPFEQCYVTYVISVVVFHAECVMFFLSKNQTLNSKFKLVQVKEVFKRTLYKPHVVIYKHYVLHFPTVKRKLP